MKTNSKKIMSVFLSLMMTFMCMTSVAVQSAGAKMILHFSDLTVSAGQDAQLDLIVENPIAIKELSNMILTAPDGFEFTGMSETSPAFNGSVTYQTDGKNLNFSITSDGSVSSEKLAVSIYMHVSENCATGNHTFTWKTMAMSCINADGYNYTPTVNHGIVNVGDSVVPPETTTQTTSTETTTTTTSKKYTYSVRFVDEETNQAVSGVKYNIVSYYALDPAQIVQTSGENPQSFEFISDTAYVALSTVTQAIPDGYYIPDGATRWELSASNPDLTVYLRKSATTTMTATIETNTTTTQTTTTETTTATTVSAYMEITIKSYPTKTTYTVGEELDLSGGVFQANGIISNGAHFTTSPEKMESSKNVDISEFDNTKAGTYKIYIRKHLNAPTGETLSTETFFEVTVSESETTTTPTTPTTTTTTTTTTVSAYMEIVITSYPTKTAYTVGEELDLSGGKWYIYGVKANGKKFVTTSYDMVVNNDFIDISQFDNTKAGTYKIFIKMQYEELSAETFFEVTVTDNGESFRLGDVDNDGMINAVDATSILTEYALLSTGDTGTFNDTQKKSADIDGDGMINAVDATFVLSYYAYLSTGGSDKIENWLAESSQNES